MNPKINIEVLVISTIFEISTDLGIKPRSLGRDSGTFSPIIHGLFLQDYRFQEFWAHSIRLTAHHCCRLKKKEMFGRTGLSIVLSGIIQRLHQVEFTPSCCFSVLQLSVCQANKNGSSNCIFFP
jgi:predicted phage tail protein